MPHVHVPNHPLIADSLAQCRDRNTATPQFRAAVAALGRWPIGAAAALVVLGVFLWFAGQNQSWLESNKGALRYVIYALILIGMMLVRPAGLLGRWELSFRKRKPPLVDAGLN